MRSAAPPGSRARVTRVSRTSRSPTSVARWGAPTTSTPPFFPSTPRCEGGGGNSRRRCGGGGRVPPIEVYHLGNVYFVKDGHHRVSVARHLGGKTIPARVIEVKTRAPLTGDMDAAALLQAREYVDFLDRSQLDRVRPEASRAVSRLGRYDRIFEDILG